MLVFVLFIFSINPISSKKIACSYKWDHPPIFINDTFSLKNFLFNESCGFTLTIPSSSYFTVTTDCLSLANLPPCKDCSDMPPICQLEYGINVFQIKENITNVIFPPQSLTISFNTDRIYGQPDFPTTKELTVTRHDFNLFGKVETIQINDTSDPQYIHLAQLEQGKSYVYTSSNGLYIWHSYCPQGLVNMGVKDPRQEDSLIFMYNGTDSLAGAFGIPQYFLCYKPVFVTGLILFIHRSYNGTNSEEKDLLVIDKTEVGFPDVNAVSLFWKTDSNVTNLFIYGFQLAVETYVYPPVISPTRVVFISQERPDGNFEEFIFTGLREFGFGTKKIQVYSGWPNSTGSTLLASYSNNTENTDLPQRFGGRVRTFIFYDIKDTNNYATNKYMYFYNPSCSSTEIEISWTENMTETSQVQDFGVFLGRKGFIRSNWLDGSYKAGISKGVLQLQKDTNSTVFRFTFTYRSGCESTASLFIKTTDGTGIQENNTLICTTGGEVLTVSSSDIYAELTGDAVVDYEIAQHIEPKFSNLDNSLVALCIFTLVYHVA